MFRTLRFYHSFFKFLSTPSSRRATQDQIHHLWRGGHFYPRPPRGGRPGAIRSRAHTSHFYPRPPRGGRRLSHKVLDMDKHISIHALREEGDGYRTRCWTWTSTFLSTPSARRATSLHGFWRRPCTDFYPRPPRGGRHLSSIMVLFVYAFLSTPSARRATMQGLSILTGIITFLSTPSARRATRRTWKRQWRRPISIHALREEGDWSRLIWGWAQSNFYPRPPRGGRPEHRAHRAGVGKISIHALREEGDSERG